MSLRKYPTIIQEDRSDCGACSLLMIIRYFGSDYSLEKLKEKSKTNIGGTNAYFIIEAAKEVGLNAWAARGDLKDLNQFPVIAHLRYKNNFEHFIVIYKKTKKTLIVSDPAIGKRVISHKQFQEISTNNYIFFSLDKKLKPYSSQNFIKDKLLNFIYNNKKVISIIIILSILFTALNIISSYRLQFIIDYVINSYSNANLLLLIFCLSLVSFMRISSDYFRNKILNYLQHNLDFQIMTEAYSQIIRLPYMYYKNKTSGDMISRLGDLTEIKDLLSQIILSLFIDSLLIFVVLIFLFKINFTMTLLILLITSIYFLSLKLINPIISYKIKQSKEKNADLNNFLYESISGVDTVKSMSLEEEKENAFLTRYNSLLNNSFQLHKIIYKFNYFKESLFEIITLLVIFISTKMILKEELSIGNTLTYIALLNFFLDALKNFASVYLQFNNVSLSLKRINSLYEIPKENLDLKKNALREIKNSQLEFINLNYSYNGIEKILKEINFKLKQGEKTLVMGESGSGKSTLFKLLLGYLETNKKTILIGGEDLHNYNLKTLREEIAYISQAEIVYNSSLYENVTLGKEIDYEDFLKVAKITRLDQILRNNNNYEMLIEEDGFNLSGGERQRIFLARALLRKVKILICDESLSQLEIEMERKILNDIFENYHDLTVIVISHRPNNKDLYDSRYLLEEGRVYAQT